MDSTSSQLLCRVRDPNDREGWSEFYALYQPFLMRIAGKLGLSSEDACEVVAQVLAQCLEGLPTFPNDRSRGLFRGWLKTLMRNVVTELARRRIREPEAAPRDAVDESAADTAIWDQWDHDYHQRVVERAMVVVREQSLPDMWACFREHVLNGRTAADVGRDLGLTANAVHQNSHRVVKRIREQLAAYGEELIYA